MQPLSPGGAPASIFAGGAIVAGGAIAVCGSLLHACPTATTKAAQPSTAMIREACAVTMLILLVAAGRVAARSAREHAIKQQTRVHHQA